MSGKVRLKSNGCLDEDPMTLQDIVYKYICGHLEVISEIDENSKITKLREDIVLPTYICDRLLDAYQRFNRDLNFKAINLFADTKRTSLKVVHLRNSAVSIDGLTILMRHKLYTLTIWYCADIIAHSHHLLSRYGQNLRSLELGIGSKILQNPEPFEKEPVDFQFNCPHLRRLVLNSVVMHHRLQFAHLRDLNHLDLTSCILANFSLEALVTLPHLQNLILFNVWPLANQLHAICRLRGLRTLDISISSSGNGHGTYDLPDQTLEMLIENLIELTHLDISGTNLAGNGVATKEQQYKDSCDIPGLASRIERPLNFLGLYHTAHYACKRNAIPAHEVNYIFNQIQPKFV